jgi:2-polyprenyl-6-methoxyphenol hydroxylase-like FAD-dependent oxidoreductase
MSRPRVLIAGAGIGGLTAAVALRAKGIDVEVCEADPEPRLTGTALGMASNATKVLRALGIDLGGDGRGQPIERFELRTARGKLIRALPIAEITTELGDPIVSIHRNDLMTTLRDAAGDTPIHYGAEVRDVESDDEHARVRCADGRIMLADTVIGADGIRSAVRAGRVGSTEPTDYGYVCWLATVAFTHPRMVRGYAGHYWGSGQRFGLIDIGAGMAYWWGTKNMPSARAREWRGGKDEILAAFDGWAPEVNEVIAATPEAAIISVPAQDRPFLEHWGSGRVTLLGDAAHPMLTSMGQGASSAIEDGYVLAEAMAREPEPVAALRSYENRRRERTRMLVRGSRRLATVEQTQNPILLAARNLGLRCAPTRTLARQNIRPMRFDLAWRP